MSFSLFRFGKRGPASFDKAEILIDTKFLKLEVDFHIKC